MLLRTLGGLALEGSSFHRPKLLLMLAFLALEGPKSRRELADLFFMDTRDPRDSLSTALRRAQAGTNDCLQLDGERVKLELPCDATELLAALSHQHPTEVLRLYRGPFVQGLDISLGEELEEWVHSTREYIAGKVRTLHLHLAEQSSDTEATTRHAEAAYSLEGAPPLEPSELQRLARLLLTVGSPLAHRAVDEAQGFGLTVEPAVRVPAVHAELRSFKAGTTFIGRTDELEELCAQLRKPTVRLMTLVGGGGIGKTRLALRAVELLRPELVDGAHVVALESVADAAVLPAQIASSLGLIPSGTENPLHALQHYLSEKRMLLVLDNLEHLLPGSAEVAQALLHACPNLTILATSRERLNLQDEWIFALQGLGYPQQAPEWEEAVDAEAIRLFIDRARRANRSFTLTPEALPAVLETCRLVDGAPLALELAAGLTRALPVEEIASELAHSLDLLETPARDVPARHRSIRAVFDHSWKLLQPSEQVHLRRLAVFRGGFRREAAAHVTGVTLTGLVSLVDKSLLQVNESGRFSFHPLVHDYCREKLEQHPEDETDSKAQHAAFLFQFLQKKGGDLIGKEQGQALAALEQELDNLRAAWEWTVREGQLEALKAASPLLRQLMDRRMRCQEGIYLLAYAEMNLDVGNEQHHAALARVLVDKGILFVRLGDFVHAMHPVQRGLRLFEHLEDQRGILDALNVLGGIIWKHGDYPEAKLIFERSLRIARSLQEDRDIANCLSYLALVELDSGNLDEAEQLYQQSLDICRSIGHDTLAVVALNKYGYLLRLKGEYQRAGALLGEALQLANRSQLQRLTPAILTALAWVSLELGDHAKACAYAEEGLMLATQGGSQDTQAQALVILGRINTAMTNFDYAETQIREALRLAWNNQNISQTLFVLAAFAELCIVTGSLDQAGGIASLVCRHAAAEPYTKRIITQVLQSLAPQPYLKGPSELYEASLEEVVQNVLLSH